MISILIANFNNNHFLIDSIESVYNQESFDDELELIVCDDSSTDDSLITLKVLAQKYNFTLLVNSDNRGVGYTKNRLIENSNGNWFVFLDSDDRFALNCIYNLCLKINQNQCNDVSMIYGNSFKLHDDGRSFEWKRSKSINGNLLLSKFEYPIFHPVIYNRKKYDLTEGIDISLKSADDFDLWYKMEEVGNIVFLDEPLYYYRINLNGVSQVGDNYQKWVEVMLEHAYCHANAARRRSIDVRDELNTFSLAITQKLLKVQQKYRLKNRAKQLIKCLLNGG